MVNPGGCFQPTIFRLVAVLAIASALMLSACGGSSKVDDAAASSATDATDTTASSDLAAKLETRLGSENAALDAVILALDGGYSSAQIIAGVDAATLEADGTIDGVTPAQSARNFVDRSEGEDEEAFGSPGADAGELVLITWVQNENRTLNALRENAKDNADVFGGGSLGNSALELILRLMNGGFSADDVTEMIVLGVDGTVELEEDCTGFRVGNEVLLGHGRDCQLEPGRYPVPSSDPADEPDEPETQPANEPETIESLVWSGQIFPDIPDAIEPPTSELRIARIEGTDEFEADFFFEYRSPFGVACTWLHTYSFKARGVGASTIPTDIFFTGESVDSHIKGDCTAEWADLAGGPTNTRQDNLVVTLTDQGIAGEWLTLGLADFVLVPES